MILRFSELATRHELLAGGKGRTLARLYQAGYPVPDGFVILPTAFSGDELVSDAWTRARAHLMRARDVDKDASFAVRSSALNEDSLQASFAGEFESVVDVQFDKEVRDAIHRVRRSRRSERVRAYSRAHGLDEDQEVAVVVQRLIRADVSGLLFTADPVSGSHGQMVGSFVHGSGERLVSGESTGKPFFFERPKGRYQGPAELRRFAGRLYKLADRLEKELGHPQDIEWAAAGGRLFILQSRPITTLREYNPTNSNWNASLTGDYLWSNVNFGEAVTEVMTPLSWTVLQFIFGQWEVLPGYETAGNIGGRPYLNISVFASVFRLLGKSREDLMEAVEGTMYAHLPDGMEIPLIPLPKRSLLSILPALFRIRIRERRALKEVPAYVASNPARSESTFARIRETETRARLLALWQEEIKPHVTESVWAVMGSVSSHAEFTTRLRRQLTELVGPDDADALISNLSEGSDLDGESGLLASLGPVVGLAKVARGEMDRETYLKQYGHRGPNEFELSVPRPSENPDWLDRQLRLYLKSPVDIDALLNNQRARVDAAWQRFRARYPRRARRMRRSIDKVARLARMRETVRSEYTRDRWVVRAFARRAGELTGLGNDIFFLTLDELLGILAGERTPVEYIPTRRDNYNKLRALPSYPSTIRGRFYPFQWAADPGRRCDIFDSRSPDRAAFVDEHESHIMGAGGAAGRVEGVVRRLDRAEEGDQLQNGEVLVAAQTDIAWTPLFPRAAAIVTDVGAPLSHAAIVAREMGIPAVVGCGNATMRLKTGDRVRVDGGRGIVEVLEESGAEPPS